MQEGSSDFLEFVIGVYGNALDIGDGILALGLAEELMFKLQDFDTNVRKIAPHFPSARHSKPAHEEMAIGYHKPQEVAT